ncbi:hypothetical protein SDC9_97733 [bioreactor metagenome]|uniref:Uncharacterized protein n=1 Tax=bioreactor metagenome TaxID=1076179 RepID=A0A645AD89_9ZZZZ
MLAGHELHIPDHAFRYIVAEQQTAPVFNADGNLCLAGEQDIEILDGVAFVEQPFAAVVFEQHRAARIKRAKVILHQFIGIAGRQQRLLHCQIPPLIVLF